MIKIISGGQAGVDRAALDAALEAGFPTGGWCPPGRTALDGPIPHRYPLLETPLECSSTASDVPRSMRTEWNIRDADATILISPIVLVSDPGTQHTIRYAMHLNKPFLLADPLSLNSTATILNWILSNRITLLNIAGPSPVYWQEGYEYATCLLRNLFKQLKQIHHQ